MMTERGLSIDHSTIFRWVQDYAPEREKRTRPYLKQTDDSWRVDETYVKARGRWMYLYRAVDSTGQTLDFLLNETEYQSGQTIFPQGLGTVKHHCASCDQCRQESLLHRGRARSAARETAAGALQTKAESLHEQHGATRPPIHEAPHPARAWVRFISNGMACDSGLRDDAHDAEGTNRRNGKGDIQGQNQFIADLFGIAA